MHLPNGILPANVTSLHFHLKHPLAESRLHVAATSNAVCIDDPLNGHNRHCGEEWV